MKKYRLILIIFLYTYQLYPQDANYGSFLATNEVENVMRLIVGSLEYSLNNRNENSLILICTPEATNKKIISGAELIDDIKISKLKIVDFEIISENIEVRIQTEIYKNSGEIIAKFDTLVISKIFNDWKISSLNGFSNIIHSVFNNSKLMSVDNLEAYTLIAPNLLFDRTCIPKPQLINPFIYEINANLTINRLNRKLYEYGSEIDVADYLHSVNPDNTGNSTLFTLDTKWNRIVYSKRGTSAIKSYGDNQNELTFEIPTAIETNEFGHVYVVDKGARKVHPLIYSYDNNNLYYFGPLNIPDGILREPIDMDYSSNGTAFNSSDDFFVITDANRRSIMKFSSSGILLKEYTTYRFGGISYNIGYPSRIALSQAGRIQFIDESIHAIIFGSLGESEIECYYNAPAQLPLNYRPTDIAIDASNNVVVTDDIGMIHKFDLWGNYLCSYRNSSLPLKYTRRISNSSRSHPGWIVLDMNVNDRWSFSNGSKRFLPGADAVRLLADDGGNFIDVSCVLTDKCYYKFEIIKVSDNSVINSYSNESKWYGGLFDVLRINKNTLVGGTYKFRVSVLPYYNSYYGSSATSWQYREIYFDHQIVAPIISNFTQTPNPLYKGSTGFVTCNLSQGNGNLNFNWSILSGITGFSISNVNSQTVSIHYSNTDALAKTISDNFSSPKEATIEKPSGAVLKCKVLNGAGNDSANVFINLATTPHGCPFVYSWNGEDWMEDNNILP